jgi:hypothetical protein
MENINEKVGVIVRNLSVRSTDSALKDALFHKFTRHAKVARVAIVGEAEKRYAAVLFRR